MPKHGWTQQAAAWFCLDACRGYPQPIAQPCACRYNDTHSDSPASMPPCKLTAFIPLLNKNITQPNHDPVYAWPVGAPPPSPLLFTKRPSITVTHPCQYATLQVDSLVTLVDEGGSVLTGPQPHSTASHRKAQATQTDSIKATACNPAAWPQIPMLEGITSLTEQGLIIGVTAPYYPLTTNDVRLYCRKVSTPGGSNRQNQHAMAAAPIVLSCHVSLSGAVQLQATPYHRQIAVASLYASCCISNSDTVTTLSPLTKDTCTAQHSTARHNMGMA
jgi:hypothetical protein